MVNTDEDALICDLAETYNIYDYKGLSLKQVATFSVGLSYNSRIKMKLSNMQYSLNDMLCAMMVDSLNFIAWSKTESAQHGENKPRSIVGSLLGIEDSKNVESFTSGEEFERIRLQIIESDSIWQQN